MLLGQKAKSFRDPVVYQTSRWLGCEVFVENVFDPEDQRCAVFGQSLVGQIVLGFAGNLVGHKDHVVTELSR